MSLLAVLTADLAVPLLCEYPGEELLCSGSHFVLNLLNSSAVCCGLLSEYKVLRMLCLAKCALSFLVYCSCLSVLLIVHLPKIEVILCCDHIVSITEHKKDLPHPFSKVMLGSHESAEPSYVAYLHALCISHTAPCMASSWNSCLARRNAPGHTVDMPLSPGAKHAFFS